MGNPEKRSVLIVEDDPLIRQLIETVLVEAGYECGPAADAAEAEAAMRTGNFDVLVCDINLPGESGIDVVRRLRADQADVAVVMVTAADDPAVAATALDAGADGYVTKPFRPNDLVIAVMNVLHQRASKHDPLTGLPHWRFAQASLGRALRRAQETGSDVAVLLIHLDRVRLIHAALGPEVADALRLAVVGRLREAAPAGATIAHLAADELLVTLEDVDGESGATALGGRVLAALLEPVAVSGRELSVSATAGVAVAHGGIARADALVRNAGIALRSAQDSGGKVVRVFENAMRERWTRRLSSEMELRQALQRDQFRLFYQPIVDLDEGSLTGFEALLRWEHPDDGIVVPGRFIPIAEETGLIVELGRWVIVEASRQLSEWSGESPGHPVPTVSVNVSARQFADPAFIERVAEALGDAGVDPGRLAFELTENQLIEGAAPLRSLQEARQLGIALVLDDFGTGYSSLGYLKRFPIQAVKIDRSFVAELPGDAANLALSRAIVTLGGSLGIHVVAEGLETREQVSVLRSLGCTLGQGYVFSRPMPAAAATRILRDGVSWLDVITPAPGAAPPPERHDSLTGRLAAAPRSGPDLEGSDGAARLLRPSDAAVALGVSVSTLRRWADTGQLPMAKTRGGHRRFTVEDVRRFKQELGGSQPSVQPLLPPSQALPSLADLLRRRGEEVLRVAGRHLYGGTSKGWFAAEEARPAIGKWIDALARACERADYDSAYAASRALMENAHIQGATLLERHRFVESFREVAVRLLGQGGAGRDELAAARRLFASLGQSLLES